MGDSSFNLEEFSKKLKDAAESTFWGYLGCELIHLTEREVEVALDIQDHHMNPIRILHGGVHASLLDNAMGLVAMAARPEYNIVTTNLNVHFAAPIHKGKIKVAAEIVHMSRKMLTVQGHIWDANGEFCTLGTGTFRVLDKHKV
jgi:uncharacterized protein (TIGR00369 family)